MTARYTHATDQAKRRAVDKLVAPAALHAGETPAVPVNALPVSDDANGIRSEIFGNGLAPENENGEHRLAVNC